MKWSYAAGAHFAIGLGDRVELSIATRFPFGKRGSFDARVVIVQVNETSYEMDGEAYAKERACKFAADIIRQHIAELQKALHKLESKS